MNTWNNYCECGRAIKLGRTQCYDCYHRDQFLKKESKKKEKKVILPTTDFRGKQFKDE